MKWNNLTKEERTEYMQLQMSPSHGSSGGGYLPDDCSECGACGQPCLRDVGWCSHCLDRKIYLDKKLKGVEG